MNDTVNGAYLDFKEIKAKADVRKVLEYLGILEHLGERSSRAGVHLARSMASWKISKRGLGFSRLKQE